MHTYFHTTLGFCLWDLLALLVLIALVALLVVHHVRQRRRAHEMEEELAEKMAAQAMGRHSPPGGAPGKQGPEEP